MASDAEYTSFLEKANEDPSAGSAQAERNEDGGKMELKAQDRDADIPGVIEEVVKGSFYMSESDEEFVPVCSELAGQEMPSVGEFMKITNYPDPRSSAVHIMSTGEWDPRGQYKEIVEAVGEACGGREVKVFRAGLGGTRCEYWVVGVREGVKGKGDKASLVGVKALGVET